MDEADAWSVLGLGAGASDEQIRRAFREKAPLLHPDHHPAQDQASATARMRDLTEARDIALATQASPAPSSSPVPPSTATAPTSSASPSRWRDLGRLVGYWRSRTRS
jgi:hypothetical protein